MKSKKEKIVYKSVEQLRDELFPQLVDEEIVEKMKHNHKQYGVYLANKAIDKMLSTPRA